MISTASNYQSNPLIVPDLAGGAIIVWTDSRNSGTTAEDIYARRIGANGIAQWTMDGVLVCNASSTQIHPVIVPSGASGAIVAWEDRRNPNPAIYAQRVDANGITQWASNGLSLIASPTSRQTSPEIVPDGGGGAIVVWQDDLSGNLDIYAQRLSSGGTRMWGAGVVVCGVANSQRTPTIVSDGSGGAIVAWIDERVAAGSFDIYAQRVDANGALQWPVAGVRISGATGSQAVIDMAPIDVALGGGAVLTWEDRRKGDPDVYAQKINLDGTVGWTSDGVPVCTTLDDQAEPRIVGDNAGGAVIVWSDLRNTIDPDIYGQNISPVGAPSWVMNGIEVIAAPQAQHGPAVARDGAGGLWVVCNDEREDASDVYAQRLTVNGELVWNGHNGIAISTAPGEQHAPAATGDGAGGIIVTWSDTRSSALDDIWAQRLDALGNLGTDGPASPTGLSASAVSGTQIQLSWTDLSGEDAYEVQRRREGNAAYRTIGVFPPVTGSNPSVVDTGLAYGTSYCYRVRAAFSDSIFYDWSGEVCATTFAGPPAVPTDVSVTPRSSTEMRITWVDNSDNEIGFEIQRKEASGSYVVIGATFLNTTGYEDNGLTANTNYCYQVRAIGNEENSPWSLQSCSFTLSAPPPREITIPTSRRVFKNIAIPVASSGISVNQLGLGTPDTLIWKLGTWSPDESRYLTAGIDLFSVDATKGYWLITQDGRSLRATGAPIPRSIIHIPIEGGANTWHQLGNPYTPTEGVPLGNIHVDHQGNIIPLLDPGNAWTEQAIWVWRDSVYVALEDFPEMIGQEEGFWIKKLTPEPITLILEALVAIPAAASPYRSAQSPLWSIDLTARQTGMIAVPLRLGVSYAATEGWDPLDLSMPPSPPGPAITLQIPKNDWGTHNGNYAREFKPLSDPVSWTFELRGAAAPGEVVIEVNATQVPEGFGLRLTESEGSFDRVLGRHEFLGLAAMTTTRRFVLTVSRDPGEPVVTKGFLQSVYPNPFSGQVGLRFSTDVEEPIEVQVFDLSGRPVRRLVHSGNQSGERVVLWNGLNDIGQPVPAGVYFVRYSSGNRVGQTRLIKL